MSNLIPLCVCIQTILFYCLPLNYQMVWRAIDHSVYQIHIFPNMIVSMKNSAGKEWVSPIDQILK